MDLQSLKKILQRYGLAPNFTYGQNFLLDEEVLDEMVTAANISSSDAVLEIGPGIANLTKKLLERAGLVLAVEKDPKFFPLLRAVKKDHRENFRFEIADALEYNFQKFFSENKYPAYKVVANIPYYATGKILEMLLTAPYKPTSVTVLMQKEVAERVTATVGNLSVLAISVQLYGKPKIVRTVPKESFYPAPKVDSAILHVELFQKPKYEIDEKKLFALIRACFAGKRKQIHNTLTNNFKLEKQKALALLQELGLDPKIRPQELSIGEWVQLASKL